VIRPVAAEECSPVLLHACVRSRRGTAPGRSRAADSDPSGECGPAAAGQFPALRLGGRGEWAQRERFEPTNGASPRGPRLDRPGPGTGIVTRNTEATMTQRTPWCHLPRIRRGGGCQRTPEGRVRHAELSIVGRTTTEEHVTGTTAPGRMRYWGSSGLLGRIWGLLFGSAFS